MYTCEVAAFCCLLNKKLQKMVKRECKANSKLESGCPNRTKYHPRQPIQTPKVMRLKSFYLTAHTRLQTDGRTGWFQYRGDIIINTKINQRWTTDGQYESISWNCLQSGKWSKASKICNYKLFTLLIFWYWLVLFLFSSIVTSMLEIHNWSFYFYIIPHFYYKTIGSSWFASDFGGGGEGLKYWHEGSHFFKLSQESSYFHFIF